METMTFEAQPEAHDALSSDDRFNGLLVIDTGVVFTLQADGQTSPISRSQLSAR